MLDPLPAIAASPVEANEEFARLTRIAASALHAKRAVAIARGRGASVSMGSTCTDAAPSDEAIEAALGLRRPLLIEDAEELPPGDARSLARLLGARALVAVPFARDPRARQGVLLVCDSQPRDWGGNAFAVLGDLVEAVLVRWDLVEEIAARRQRESELLLLHSLTEAIFSATDVASAIHVTLRKICEFTGWEYGEAWLADAADARLEFAPAWFAVRDDPFPHVSRTFTFERGVGLPGRVWEQRRPIWESDLAAAPSYPRLQLASSVGIKAAVGIPVTSHGEIVAVLVFHSSSLGEEDRHLVRLITTLAAELGGVVAAKRAEDRLRISEARFAGILDVAADSIVSIDGSQRITLFNRAAEKMFGYDAAEVLGQRLEMLLPEEARAHHAAHVRGFVGSGDTARFMSQRGEIRGRKKSGALFPAEATISRLQHGDESVCTVVLRDITARKEAEALLKAQATRDDLTGLHNRRGFLLLAEQKLLAARRSGAACFLLYLDLDGFKGINDVFGHSAGDEALVEVAAILRRTFRESDVVGRLGGDEFVVLARCEGEESEAAMRRRLAAELDASNREAGRSFEIALSLGSARWDPAEPVALEELLSRADAAMLDQKRRRKAAR